MLMLPVTHPFLLRLLTEHFPGIQQLSAPPKHAWHTIIEESVAQRVSPLLFQWISLPDHQSLVPLDLRDRLERELVQHATWNLLLATELRTILLECERHGVPCIPIRGPVLAETLYGSGSVRQMDDLDLLVHRKDLPTIKHIFKRFGYRLHEQRPGFLETFSYSLEFVHPTHGFLVEPHWTLAYPPYLDPAPMQPVWKRCRRQRWMDIEILCLSCEDLVLHLCLHIQHKGRQTPLLWFYELDTVIRRHHATFNWSIFIEQVRLMEQSAAIADALTALVETLQSPIPHSVVERLTDPHRNSSSSRVYRIDRGILARSLPNSGEEFAMLASLHTFKDRLRYIFSLVFPSLEYMIRRHGASTPAMLVCYYLARWFRMGIEGFRLAAAWISTGHKTQQS